MYDPRWHSMIEGWAEVHRQHDVCEFFTFLMKHCDCSLFSGSWQARMPTAAGDMRLISLTRGSAPSPSSCTFLNIGHIWQFPGYNHWSMTGIDVWTAFMVFKSLPRCLCYSYIASSGKRELQSKIVERFDWTMSSEYQFSRGEAAAWCIMCSILSLHSLNITGTHPSRATTPRPWCRKNFGIVMMAESLKPNMFSKINNRVTVTLFSTGFNLISVLSDHSSSGECACLQVLRDGAHLVVLFSR